MTEFNFGAFRRIPRIDVGSFPFKAEVRNFAHYTLHVDYHDIAHIRALAEFGKAMIHTDKRVQRAAYEFLQKAGVMPFIKKFQSGRVVEGGFPPDYGDLFYLYSYIRTRQPRRVLEYGSGISTLVMALALRQNGGEGRLGSIEPSEEGAQKTRAGLPAHLLERSEVICSPGMHCEVEGRDTVCFAERPLANPDMIYIDGAPQGACFDGAENVALLEENFDEDGVTIFIDGRRRAVHFFNLASRARRFEISSYAVDIEDVHTGTTFTCPFGFDQFSNTMVRWRGSSLERRGMSADD